LSFLIPLVERLLKAEEPNKKGYVRSIVLAPTKELATQIYDVLKGLLEFHSHSAAACRPPTPPDSDDEDALDGFIKPVVLTGPAVLPQLLVGGRTKLSEDLATFTTLNPNVLIATPKRLLEVIQSSKVVLKRHWFDLLVLDEADRLLDANFREDLQKILDILPKERRTGLFSASVSEAVNELVRVGMRYPFKISAKVRSKSGALDKRTPESLRLYHVTCKATAKIPYLRRILAATKTEKCIVYVSTRASVDYWNHILPALLDMAVYPLHGDHKARIRMKNLNRFRDSVTPAILLTTDVLARGIDIPDIDLVVQLDAPIQPKDFIHRCGRSGRAGKRGVAVTFLNEGCEEDYIKYLDLQGTKLEPYPDTPTFSSTEINDAIITIRKTSSQKRELHDRSQKAFVSWVQAYSKTLPTDIFDVKRLNWAEIGRSWGLLQWPKMPELKRHFPTAAQNRTYELGLPADFRLDTLAYKDKVREATRQEYLATIARGERPALPKRLGGALAEMQRRKANAWSSQKDAKALKEARREKKIVRREAEGHAKMSESEKVTAAELKDLIEQVRIQTAAAAEETFEGFDD
jgi:ATP-dependent RNA helicase DDX55/SPB4